MPHGKRPSIVSISPISTSVAATACGKPIPLTAFAQAERWFNTTYFSQSIVGLLYQNGLKFEYDPISLALYLPAMAAWIAFASVAHRSETAHHKDGCRACPTTVMRSYLIIEAMLRALKNVNWVLTVAAETATAHGIRLGMIGATGITHCASLAISLFTPLGIGALVGGLAIGAMDAWYRNLSAQRTTTTQAISALIQSDDTTEDFASFAMRHRGTQPVTFDAFTRNKGIDLQLGESNRAAAAAMASGLVHGAYRAANILFMVKLVSVTAASTLLGPAAPIFLGLFAAYAVGNALSGLYKEGREQANLHQKRSALYDKLFPGIRTLYQQQAQLRKAQDRLAKAIEQAPKSDTPLASDTLEKQKQDIDQQLTAVNQTLTEKRAEYARNNIKLTPPPAAPSTWASHFYSWCNATAHCLNRTLGSAFATADTVINSVKNGCKLGACIAGLGASMMVSDNSMLQAVGALMTGLGFTVGAVGLVFGSIRAFSSYQTYTNQLSHQKSLETSAVGDPPKAATVLYSDHHRADETLHYGACAAA